jgi:hypothetical protein
MRRGMRGRRWRSGRRRGADLPTRVREGHPNCREAFVPVLHNPKPVPDPSSLQSSPRGSHGPSGEGPGNPYRRFLQPKPQRRTRSPRYGVPPCRGKSAEVAKRPVSDPPPETPTDSQLFHRCMPPLASAGRGTPATISPTESACWTGSACTASAASPSLRRKRRDPRSGHPGTASIGRGASLSLRLPNPPAHPFLLPGTASILHRPTRASIGLHERITAQKSLVLTALSPSMQAPLEDAADGRH